MSEMVRCINCKHLERDGWCGQTADSPYEHDERRCCFFKQCTNGDRIRRMTDADLARLLCDISSCRKCMAKRCCGSGSNGFLDWLKEESNAKD
uniref:Uncharacterized protein n=1 Tax=Siphoviridae sp. ctmIh35 TaxID=2827932 RepID=A0A8S5T9C8_9CAUD|nr:MAG TPA: hypothetical protein [Siphoviridae sp. ctmIh35]